MSLTELEREVAELSIEDRLKLSIFLANLEAEKESEFRQEVDARMKRMDSGQKVSMEEFEENHRKLRAEGR